MSRTGAGADSVHGPGSAGTSTGQATVTAPDRPETAQTGPCLLGHADVGWAGGRGREAQHGPVRPRMWMTVLGGADHRRGRSRRVRHPSPHLSSGGWSHCPGHSNQEGVSDHQGVPCSGAGTDERPSTWSAWSRPTGSPGTPTGVLVTRQRRALRATFLRAGRTGLGAGAADLAAGDPAAQPEPSPVPRARGASRPAALPAAPYPLPRRPSRRWSEPTGALWRCRAGPASVPGSTRGRGVRGPADRTAACSGRRSGPRPGWTP